MVHSTNFGIAATRVRYAYLRLDQALAERGAPGADEQCQAPVVGLRQEQIKLHSRVHGQGELIGAASGVVPLG